MSANDLFRPVPDWDVNDAELLQFPDELAGLKPLVSSHVDRAEEYDRCHRYPALL